MRTARPRRSHGVCSRYGACATCGRSARVTNAEWQGVLRCISVRSGGEGGLVAGGTVSGAILSRGDVPCMVHDTSTVCVHCVSGWEIAREIATTVTRQGGLPRALLWCYDVSKSLPCAWERVGRR